MIMDGWAKERAQALRDGMNGSGRQNASEKDGGALGCIRPSFGFSDESALVQVDPGTSSKH
jgi:hypothetical protein